MLSVTLSLCVSVCTCTLLLSHVGAAGVPQDKAIALFNKCKQQSHATEDVNEIVKKNKIPTSPEGKCMLHCVLESKKLIKGSQVDTVAFADYYENLYKDQPRELETAARAIAICGIKLGNTKGMDKCGVAFKIFQCGKENGLKLS